MRSQVPAVLRAAGGESTWSALAAATSDSAVNRAVVSGTAVLGLPGVVLLPDVADDDAARRHRVLPQRPALRRLVEANADRCRSELELWGYEQVFTGQHFAELQRQVEVLVDGRLAVLDCYDPRAALAIELDGRQHHGSPRDRERDAERDVRLASVGIQTARFSHRRPTRSPEECRREALRTHETRRAHLAGRPRPLVVEVPGRAGEAPRLRPALPAAARGA